MAKKKRRRASSGIVAAARAVRGKKKGRRIKSGYLKGQHLAPRSKNPGRCLIGERAYELTYEGGDGKPKKSRWVHKFETHVRVFGLPDGTVLLEAVDPGLSLWENYDVEIRR